jgi:hypothetical protein
MLTSAQQPTTRSGFYPAIDLDWQTEQLRLEGYWDP